MSPSPARDFHTLQKASDDSINRLISLYNLFAFFYNFFSVLVMNDLTFPHMSLPTSRCAKHAHLSTLNWLFAVSLLAQITRKLIKDRMTFLGTE